MSIVIDLVSTILTMILDLYKKGEM